MPEPTKNDQLASKVQGSTTFTDAVDAEIGKYDDSRAAPPKTGAQPQTSPNPFK